MRYVRKRRRGSSGAYGKKKGKSNRLLEKRRVRKERW
jgi:hypothetical protein